MTSDFLIKTANILDSTGMYVEADFVIDTMIRLARDRFNGQQTYYGNTRQPVPFRQMPGRNPAVPTAPTAGAPIAAPTTPSTPAAAPAPNPAPPIKSPFTEAEAKWMRYLREVYRNPKTDPSFRAALELEESLGNFDPKTGYLSARGKENLINMQKARKMPGNLGGAASAAGNAGKAADAVSEGFSASGFARTLSSTKAGQGLVKSLYGAQRTFNAVASKIPPPVFRVLSKVKYVFIFLNFARFMQALLNGTLEYKQTIEFIAACASIFPQVTASLGAIPIVGPGLVIAIGAVNLGAADVVEFFANPEAGLNYMGFQLTGESMRRKTDKIDFATVDTSTLDPAVQIALKESVPLIQQGKKIREILTDPALVQRHPWLSKRDDIRFTQFSGALGMGGFYKQNRAQQQEQPTQQGLPEQGQTQQQGQQGQAQGTMPGTTNQQGQALYNNAKQVQQQSALRNHNDLLYKAYVDTVQTTNVTLENLKNYRDQIISKITNLAPMYPNINAQQAITALDNRIRKYSAQAQPA